MGFLVNNSSPRPPVLKAKVLKFLLKREMCLNAKKSRFLVQPDEKIWKNRFFEAHIERAVITHLITIRFAILL